MLRLTSRNGQHAAPGAAANPHTIRDTIEGKRVQVEENGEPYRTLFLPEPALADIAFPVAVVATNESPDIVVLTQQKAALLIEKRLRQAVAATIPILDLSGADGRCNSNRQRCDAYIRSSNKALVANGLAMMSPLVRRFRNLPTSVLMSPDPRVHLLARLFVRDRTLEPERDPHTHTAQSPTRTSAQSRMLQSMRKSWRHTDICAVSTVTRSFSVRNASRDGYPHASIVLHVAVRTCASSRSSTICDARIRRRNTSSGSRTV